MPTHNISSILSAPAASIQSEQSDSTQQTNQYYLQCCALAFLMCDPRYRGSCDEDINVLGTSLEPSSSTPSNHIQADLEAMGWLAFLDLSQNSLSPATLQWVEDKLAALQTSGLLDPQFAGWVKEGLNALQTNSFNVWWTGGAAGKSGALDAIVQTLMTLLTNPDNAKQVRNYMDDDTMFTAICLFRDIQNSSTLPDKYSGFSEDFFKFYEAGDQAEANCQYSRFVAYYLWKNQDHFYPTDWMYLARDFGGSSDPETTKFANDLLDILHALEKDPSKWLTQYGTPDDLEYAAKDSWAGFVTKYN